MFDARPAHHPLAAYNLRCIGVHIDRCSGDHCFGNVARLGLVSDGGADRVLDKRLSFRDVGGARLG
jgi:hypothetical protein